MKTRHEWVTAIGDTIVVKDKQIIWKREGCEDVNYLCLENGSGKVLGAEILRLAGERDELLQALSDCVNEMETAVDDDPCFASVCADGRLVLDKYAGEPS